MREKKADRKLKQRYSRKAKERKSKKKRKYLKFYYTPEEDHYQRYLLEKTVAKRLCRGETKPIVSFLHMFLYYDIMIIGQNMFDTPSRFV